MQALSKETKTKLALFKTHPKIDFYVDDCLLEGLEVPRFVPTLVRVSV